MKRLAFALVFFATSVNSQTLRIGLAEDPDILDPTMARTFVGRIVFAGLCDKLFDLDEKLNVVPQLATSYEWSADNKSLTLKLRSGVAFHDGEKMDAQAVKYSLERHKNMPGSNRRGELAVVSSVEALDPSTVRLNLSAPFAPLLAVLTDRAGMMLSPNAAQSIDRIVDVFPPHQQQQIRVQLSSVIEAVISQQLLPNMQFTGHRERRPVTAAVAVSSSVSGDGRREEIPTLQELGRVPAVEIMIATPAIRNLIRETKTHQIHSTIQTGAQYGMMTMDQSLHGLYSRRLITLESALARAIYPDELRKMIERGGS